MRRPARPKPLPRACNGAGEAIEQAHIQAADIHPQLQRVRRHHAVELASPQPRCGIAPLRGQVAAAISSNARRLARVAVEHILQVLGQHFHHQAGIGEYDGLEPGFDGAAGDAGGLGAGRGAQAEIRVDHGRVPEQQMLFPAGAPDWSITPTGWPSSLLASSPGFAIVAEQKI